MLGKINSKQQKCQDRKELFSIFQALIAHFLNLSGLGEWLTLQGASDIIQTVRNLQMLCD